MNPGILRHTVDIQSAQGSVADGYGNTTKSWSVLYAAVPAEIKVINTKEVFVDGQVQSRNFFQVTMRYLPSLTDAMRLIYNSRVLAIMSIANVLERNISLVMECQEIFAE